MRVVQLGWMGSRKVIFLSLQRLKPKISQTQAFVISFLLKARDSCDVKCVSCAKLNLAVFIQTVNLKINIK